MTIVLATPTASPAVVRIAVPPVATGSQTYATVALRSPLTTSSRRPDAAAPLGRSGRWL